MRELNDPGPRIFRGRLRYDSYVSPINAESKDVIDVVWEMTEGRNRSPFAILDKYQMALAFCRKEQFSSGE
jgi:hypothetical protein